MLSKEENGRCDEVARRPIFRESPVSHPPVDAPLCPACQEFELAFFDLSCPGCREILENPKTTIAEIFAIIRQWVPQTQKNIEVFVNEILHRGAHVDDRDGLTEMNLLHYSCKAGASGVGDVNVALRVVKMLLDNGADVNAHCRWINMNSLQYASYFDVAPVVKLILTEKKGIDVNVTCLGYENGTALHIAARNLCYEAAATLLDFGASKTVKDGGFRIPLDCVPETACYDLFPDIRYRVRKMKELLSCDVIQSNQTGISGRGNHGSISGKAVLDALNLRVNDRVIIAGCKPGTLRYCGTTAFAPGIWAGVELDTNDGKHDGQVKGVRYFKCPPKHGIFVAISKVVKDTNVSLPKMLHSSRRNSRTRVNHGKIDVSHVTSKVFTGRNSICDARDLKIGDRVIVKGGSTGDEERNGVVRFIGSTSFALGCWVGLELDKEAEGRHDGSIGGKRYFTCPPRRGIFTSASRIKTEQNC